MAAALRAQRVAGDVHSSSESRWNRANTVCYIKSCLRRHQYISWVSVISENVFIRMMCKEKAYPKKCVGFLWEVFTFKGNGWLELTPKALIF